MPSEFEKLLNDDVDSTENAIDSTNEKVDSIPKSNKKKSSTQSKIDSTKILDETELWKKLLEHKSDFGMKELLALLTSLPVGSIKNLVNEKVSFKRTPAASAIIKIYRILLQEGFL